MRSEEIQGLLPITTVYGLVDEAGTRFKRVESRDLIFQ